MTLILLLDLDGTLLDNEIVPFVAVYTKALAKHLASYVEPGRLVQSLLAATQSMRRQQRPDATLQDTFDTAFYPALGLEKDKVQGAIDQFYAEVFPTLQTFTHIRPEAAQLVERAFERGYLVGIATDPLFPRTAILQRLAWAGLSPENYPFALIPSYETFHFAKPNPAYFAEFLSLIGWPEGSVVMVGNDLDADIAGACEMGIKSFYIHSGPASSIAGPYAPSAGGTLTEVLPWLEAMPSEALQPDYSSLPALLATLRVTPAALSSFIKKLPSERWASRPRPGEWSLTEIMCHLRDVESEVNLPRFQKMITETNPFLPGMDTDPWAESRGYARQDGASAFEAFTRARLELLRLLDSMKPSDWQRIARHAIFGPTHLKELVSIAAGHDRLHIQQIYQVIHTVAG